MKLYGSLTELVAAIFRKNGFLVTTRPNQATTYTAARDSQLPPGDSDSILVGESNIQTLTGKTISGASNTLSNVNLASQVTGILPGANGGTGQNSTAVFPTSGNVSTDSNTQTFSNKSIDASTNPITNISNAEIKSGAAIDAAKIADGSVSSTEFQYINSLTSNAQTQIDGKVADTGDTMTGNLVMDNQKEVRFRETTGSGTNYAAIKAPSSLAADYTLTLPVDDGASGEVLSTDGSGVLSWTAAGSINNSRQDFTGLKRFNDGVISVTGVDFITGNVTLTDADNRTQEFAAGGPLTITLPTTNIKKGEIWTIYNNNVNAVYLKASDATSLDGTLISGNGSVCAAKIEQRGKIIVTPMIDTPVTNTDWRVLEVIESGDCISTFNASGDGYSSVDIGKYSRVNNIVHVTARFYSPSIAGLTNAHINFEMPHPVTFGPYDANGVGYAEGSSNTQTAADAILNVDVNSGRTLTSFFYNGGGISDTLILRYQITYELTGY